MDRAEAEHGPSDAGSDGMTPPPHEGPACPTCLRPIEAEWRACPDCGAELGRASPPSAAEQSASALPSVDTGEVELVPAHGGARRPITIVEVGSSLDSGTPVTLGSLALHRSDGDSIPQLPLTEMARQPVTILHAAEVQTPPERHEAAKSEAIEAAPNETTLAPTVVIMPSETAVQRRLERADIAEIERVFGQALARALREQAALQAPHQVALLAASAGAQRSWRKRMAGVGAGLLIGASLADLLVLNWDIWVKGNVDSSIGWLQQTGIIGMAALAGAGMAAFILGAARGSRRAARGR